MSNAFVDRVFQRLRAPGSSYKFDTWRVSGRPTSEGVGVLPAEVDVEQMASRILDVDGYRGNIDHVVESRAIAHPGLALPEGLRFYQRLKIPLMGEVHFINEMRDHGERDGWRVIAWQLVADATEALDKRRGARFDYNDGAWLLRPDGVGYALSSAPRKSDVGRLKYAAMTRGADATASPVLQNNIKGMLRWSGR